MIKKGYCGLLYDYHFEGSPVDPKKNYCLSKFVYNCYLQLGDKDRKKISFKVINFTDPNKSIRINPIHPTYLENRAFLEEYVTVLLNNLNPDKKDDFWNLSTKSLLKGIIVFLANNAKSCCTLPHVLTLAMKPIDQVLTLIQQDREAYGYASSIFDAAKVGEKAAGQLVGIIASFKASLQLLINKELFWALSAHEIPLDINDGASPMLFCIGNLPTAKSAFSPVIALLITVCFRSMYGHGKTKSFVAIDELPTLYIPNLSELPATARKYGIATIACIQSGAQLEKTYTTVGAKEIQENLSNQFIGNCGVYSAGYGSSIFGKEAYFVHSTTASKTYSGNNQHGNNQTIGESISMHEKDSVKSQSFAALDVGFFAGRVVESDSVFFQEQFKNVAAYDKRFRNEALKDIPDSKQVSQEDFIANQRKIEQEIDLLLSSMHMPS